MRTKDENKKLAIYNAAMELINLKGLENTSMAKIARKANVSSSTIYVYFKNKEDMLNKLYIMAKEESSQEVFKGFSSDISVKDAFSLFIKNLFNYMINNPIKFSFNEQFYNSPQISKATKEEGIKYYKTLMDIYKRGVEEGTIIDYPRELVGAYMFAPIMNLVKLHHSEEFKINNKIIDEAIRMSWQAIKK